MVRKISKGDREMNPEAELAGIGERWWHFVDTQIPGKTDKEKARFLKVSHNTVKSWRQKRTPPDNRTVARVKATLAKGVGDAWLRFVYGAPLDWQEEALYEARHAALTAEMDAVQ